MALDFLAANQILGEDNNIGKSRLREDRNLLLPFGELKNKKSKSLILLKKRLSYIKVEFVSFIKF